MTDNIRLGTNVSLTVGEAACPDDAVILGATDADDEGNERANQSLTAFAQEGNR